MKKFVKFEFSIYVARHLVVGISQTLRRWTDGTTYVRQGDHYVGHISPHSSLSCSSPMSSPSTVV